jgi:hypothetical protein
MSKLTIELSGSFQKDISQLIGYYQESGFVTYGEAIGVMIMTVYDLCAQAADDQG